MPSAVESSGVLMPAGSSSSGSFSVGGIVFFLDDVLVPR